MTSADQSARMRTVIALITDLQDACGVDPKEQRLSLLMIETLYETPDDKLAVLRDILNARAQLEASFLSVDQVAAKLRIKPKLVRQLAKWGALEGAKFRRGWLFTPEAVDAFIERQTFLGDVRCNSLREPAS